LDLLEVFKIVKGFEGLKENDFLNEVRKISREDIHISFSKKE